MKNFFVGFILIIFAQTAFANYTKGYFKTNGTYVNGYYKTAPNNTKFDNYSTKGNYNPYTGKSGTVSPYSNNNYSNYNNYSNGCKNNFYKY